MTPLRILAAVLAAALLPAGAAAARAGTILFRFPVVIEANLTIAMTPANPTVSCAAAPGSPVATFSASGGDGNPATFSLSGTTDFALTGTNNASLVVGPSGIAAANCGTTEELSVAATQP